MLDETKLKYFSAKRRGQVFHWKITGEEEKAFFLIQTLFDRSFVYHGKGDILRRNHYKSHGLCQVVEKRVVIYCGAPFTEFPVLYLPSHFPDLMFSKGQYKLGEYTGGDEFWYGDKHALLGDHFFWGDEDIIELLKTKIKELGS